MSARSSEQCAGSGRVRTEAVEVTQELIDQIVSTGGYTHPLFNPSTEQVAAGQSAPLPGQGILLLMGGLLEQSGALDHAIAMVEMKNARFLQMVQAGTTLSVDLEPTESRETSSGKVIQHYRWTALDGNETPLAEVYAVMLMHKIGEPA